MFPKNVVKGYGQFEKREERPGTPNPGEYWVFTGPPTASKAITDADPTYASLRYTPDDLEKIANPLNSPSIEANDHSVDWFYWGPGTGAPENGINQTISMTATFVKIENGAIVDRFTGTDTATFNVIRPTGDLQKLWLGTAGVSNAAISDKGSQYLSLDKATPRDNTSHARGEPLGLKAVATVNKVGKLTAGSFIVTQTMNQLQERGNGASASEKYGYFLDASNKVVRENGVPLNVSDRIVLDVSPAPDPPSPERPYAYLGRSNDQVGPSAGPKVSTQNVGDKLYFNDSPASELEAGWTYWTRGDNFYDTVMFNPDPRLASSPDGAGLSSIWIPVGEATWEWSTLASNPTPAQATTWVVMAGTTPTATFTPYAASELFPVWERNIKQVHNWLPTPLPSNA